MRVIIDRYSPEYRLYTGFFEACVDGNVYMAELLLKEKGELIDINMQETKFMDSPLHLASGRGHLEIVKLLVEYGADVNIRNRLGETPIFLACRNNHIDVVRYLIEHGAEVRVCGWKKGFTPLHYACIRGSVALLELLIKNNADIHAKTVDGITPIHTAAMEENVNAVIFLVRHGADLYAKSKRGYTPFDHLQNGCLRNMESKRKQRILDEIDRAMKERMAKSLESYEDDAALSIAPRRL